MQDTKRIPIRCETCGKTLAFASGYIELSCGEIIIKCRNCKQETAITSKAVKLTSQNKFGTTS